MLVPAPEQMSTGIVFFFLLVPQSMWLRFKVVSTSGRSPHMWRSSYQPTEQPHVKVLDVQEVKSLFPHIPGMGIMDMAP